MAAADGACVPTEEEFGIFGVKRVTSGALRLRMLARGTAATPLLCGRMFTTKTPHINRY